MAGPGRQPNERDVLQSVNGSPLFLGVIVSTGTLINNATTATPFFQTPLGPSPSPGVACVNLANTLAGKTLLCQASAAGSLLPSTTPTPGVASPATGTSYPSLALQSVVPVLPNTAPGRLMFAGEAVELTMKPGEGWLQWLPTSGSGNLFVWELS